MKRIAYLLITTALYATPALAHDPKLHKGPKVEGKVVSVTGDRLEVGTALGAVAVRLSPETTYEQGMEGQKTTKSALRNGQEVMISGHKLGSGEFAATEVMVHGAGGDGAKPHAPGGADESKPHSHDDGDE